MYQGQKMVDNQGYEILLFPLDILYITQGENGSISHSLAMDFVGFNNESGQIFSYPLYAPCTLKCVSKNYENNQAYIIYESVNKVHKADGSIGIINMVIMHDNNPLYNIGDIINQGDLLGHTGTAGYVTGDHTHINVANGNYTGWTHITDGFYELNNSISLYNAFYINNTAIYNDFGYNWKTYNNTNPIQPDYKFNYSKKSFNWCLYSNKILKRKVV